MPDMAANNVIRADKVWGSGDDNRLSAVTRGRMMAQEEAPTRQ